MAVGDPKVASFVGMALREQGHAVDKARDGEEAVLVVHLHEYDAVLLDVAVPKKNGLQVVVELRSEGYATPILLLGAADSTAQVTQGLDAGADGYLARPFHIAELLARLRAVLRRSPRCGARQFGFGPLQLRVRSHRVLARCTQLRLMPKEFQLLECLLRHASEVVHRNDLVREVWGLGWDRRIPALSNCIARLGCKLRSMGYDGLLQTVSGIGHGLGVASGSQRRQLEPLEQ
ncbi:MAG: response regulator [Gemmatimonadales bacterium]|nr:response regulator [Gemmatimonadales bacterium]